MNSIKILMALVAVCILAMPAFSMPDRGTGQMCQECKQNLCDCSKPMVEDKCQEDNQKPCDCLMPMMAPKNGPIKVKIIKSMMEDRCQGDRPTIGSGNGPIRVKVIKSMMGDRCQDDRQNSCEFPRAMMGQDDKLRLKAHVKSMMGDRYQDDDRNSCNCPRHTMEDRR
jgi:hypothetical protein